MATQHTLKNSCSTCGWKAVRHIRQRITLYPAIPFDWQEDIGEVQYWNNKEWLYTPPTKRFWLPFSPDLSYEDGLAQILLWMTEAVEAKDQLVIMSMDFGVIKGGDGPWCGSVALGVFRGPLLDFIEPEEDYEPKWLALARLSAVDPSWKLWPAPKIRNFFNSYEKTT